MLDKFFRRKSKKLHFALVIADVGTEKFQFTSDKDCKMFIVTGECTPRDVIPRTVLREVVERFDKKEPDPQGEISISEKAI